MCQRLYPDTLPVLASYWLKSLCYSGHNRAWWASLNEEIRTVLREKALDPAACGTLVSVQLWIERAALRSAKIPEARHAVPPFRADLPPDLIVSYSCRLLNEWLSGEVANLLTGDSEVDLSQNDGIPVLVRARALEHLLIRERLSPVVLELLLQGDLLSPRSVYPADAEIMRDVVAGLLGWVRVSPPPVMPAVLLGVAAGSALPADYQETTRGACFVRCERGDEVHVPIASAHALEILKSDPPRIESVIVTMDGRWWHSVSLERKEQDVVVYRPGGRLRIDFSSEHAKLAIPWRETQLSWRGAVRFQDRFEIFGREWHTSSLEVDGEHTLLHLTFSRFLPIVDSTSVSENSRRLCPASVDMAWSELEHALASSLLQNSREPVEQLRRTDLIPFGRALYGLAELVKHQRRPKREELQTRLEGIRYLHAEVSLTYGRIPWTVLPEKIRGTLVKSRLDPASVQVLRQIFDRLPEHKIRWARPPEDSTPPSQAA
jgi:hypothetical protein